MLRVSMSPIQNAFSSSDFSSNLGVVFGIWSRIDSFG